MGKSELWVRFMFKYELWVNLNKGRFLCKYALLVNLNKGGTDTHADKHTNRHTNTFIP